MNNIGWIIIGVMLLFVAPIYNRSNWGRDSTDPKGGRSGLRLYTDAATGVQYVGNGRFGGITVRVGQDGRPFMKD